MNNQSSNQNKKLFIIIPVFNEKETIGEIIRRVSLASAPEYQKEIIIVDDGSNDGTMPILEALKKRYSFILLRHLINMGKGAAIKTALKYVTDGLVVIQDADLEYNPDDYEKLLKAFDRQKFPVVYGSRNLNAPEKGYWPYFLGGKIDTFILNLLFGSRLTDMHTGYKLFRADIIKNINLQADGFEFCPEVTAKILKSGYPIKEIPIGYEPRKFSEGKKIRLRDGLVAIWTIVKYKIK